MTRLSPHSSLPTPSTEEKQHSQRLAALLRERIAASGGWLTFETFMQLALYAPGLGYYSAGSAKLGAAGDFVTAPEVSDLFSQCVARQCAEILSAVRTVRQSSSSDIKSSSRCEILEFGAGTGRMAAVVLETLAALDALPERYCILEVSADLRQRQQQRIAQLPSALRERVTWLDQFPEEPLHGVMLANEVLDALPCRRFVLRRTQEGEYDIQEWGVGLTLEGGFVACERAADEALREVVLSLLRELPGSLPEGYTSEISLTLEPWIAGVAAHLKRGALLLFDYGLPRTHYYHPERHAGTLLCHFKHHAHDDPFINVGIQDITAWVDFTRVAEAADAAGLEVLGFNTQAAFLLGSGIQDFVAHADDARRQIIQAGEMRRLLLPGEMGEAFKVMALGKNLDTSLSGFALQDLRRTL